MDVHLRDCREQAVPHRNVCIHERVDCHPQRREADSPCWAVIVAPEHEQAVTCRDAMRVSLRSEILGCNFMAQTCEDVLRAVLHSFAMFCICSDGEIRYDWIIFDPGASSHVGQAQVECPLILWATRNMAQHGAA